MTPRDRWVSAADGLPLYAADYLPAQDSGLLPLVCLAALTRSSADFAAMARFFAGKSPRSRRVLALDSRGRGRSGHDSKPANYSLPVELGDVNTLLAAAGVERAIFVGSSRGGLLSMMLLAERPHAVAGLVLNDVGPVLEPAGLAHVRDDLAVLTSAPPDWESATARIATLYAAQFPALGDADFAAIARASWFERADGRLEPNFDPRVADIVTAVDVSVPRPPLWHLFETAPEVPVLVLRGECSDVLSRHTLAEMQRRRRNVTAIEIPGQGHVPLLDHAAVLPHLAAFIERCDPAPTR